MGQASLAFLSAASGQYLYNAASTQTVLPSSKVQGGTRGTRREQQLSYADYKHMLLSCSTIYSERREDIQILTKSKY